MQVNELPISLVVFDVTKHGGQCITNLPLLKHKEILAEFVPSETSLFAKSQFIEGISAAYSILYVSSRSKVSYELRRPF